MNEKNDVIDDGCLNFESNKANFMHQIKMTAGRLLKSFDTIFGLRSRSQSEIK